VKGSPKILIANRGEIALRVIRSCRKLGIPTVAVYSEADKGSLHVALADEAVCIGPPPTNQSYLVKESILAAAKKTSATAVHPGFGFLSENADFAESCQKAGLVFIGPNPDAIRAMGDKIEARRRMKAAGVPVVPGTVDPLKDVEEAKRVARDVGFPVMIKATAGGGGKGMRKVDREEQLPQLFEEATSEAKKFFGNGALYLEKFINNPHHIEVQLFGCGKSQAFHLFERECSIQRRHQKVIEEAPSPLITAEIRKKLTTVSVEGAKAIGYLGAGTMEFVADDDGNFYFMEMNTRLQVEHTVTEWVTGVDLVEEQVRLALGMELRLKKQEDIQLRGHSLQCRVYAEDPVRFFPSPGVVSVARWPQGPFVRVDTHIDSGSEISMFYDPMIAKVTTWGRDRKEAIDRMRVALEETVLIGIETNIAFHLAVLAEKTFQSGRTTTGYIEDVLPMNKRKEIAGQLPSEEELEQLVRLASQDTRTASKANGVARDSESSLWRARGWTASLRKDSL
jgi:acetyl-CoA carboxylase biotin carboxylase subunit